MENFTYIELLPLDSLCAIFHLCEFSQEPKCAYLEDLLYTDLGICVGGVRSFKRNICVHDIGFDWEFSDLSSNTGWPDAGEGLAVKCLYEPGDC